MKGQGMTAAPRKRGRPVEHEARARRREEILACAGRVFASRGYPNTDVQAVADEAGVAKGTIYLYFPSKAELFLAAVDQGMREMLAYIDERAQPVADPLERMGTAIGAYLTFFKEHPELVELLIQERAEFRDRKTPTYFEWRDTRREAWHGLLQGLIDAG